MTSSGAPGDARRLFRREWTIIICGSLVLVASFLPWEAATSGGLGAVYTGSASAWNAGFAAWFGSLLCAAAAAAVAARQLGYAVGVRGIGPNLAACGLAAAGAALLVVRVLTLPRGGSYGPLGTSGSYGYGPSFGAFAGAGLAAVQAIVAMLSLRASGERLPAFAAPGGTRPGQPPQPGISGRPGQVSQPGPYGQAYPPGAAPPPIQPAPSIPPHTAASSHLSPAPPSSAPAPPPAWPAPTAQQPYQDQELAQRLSRLDDLRARGLISDSEHAEQRRRIISQL
jgi:hypothetical protein